MRIGAVAPAKDSVRVMKEMQNRTKRFSVSAVLALAAVAFVFSPMRADAITDEDIKNLGKTAGSSNAQVSEPVSAGKIMMRLTLSLGLVLGLVAAAAWGAKRYLPAKVTTGRGGPIEVMATRGIGAGKSLLLVRVKEKTVLLGVTAQNVQFLTDIEVERGAWDEAAVQAGLHDEPFAARGPQA